MELAWECVKNVICGRSGWKTVIFLKILIDSNTYLFIQNEYECVLVHGIAMFDYALAEPPGAIKSWRLTLHIHDKLWQMQFFIQCFSIFSILCHSYV